MTAAFTKRMTEATKDIGHRDIKGATKDCFILDSGFSSNNLEEDVMDVGADLIGMVKIDTKGFCRYTIEKLTYYFPGGYYLMLRSNKMVPGRRPLVDIGYKYNVHKVHSFIDKDNIGSTQEELYYLYKYPEQFSNVSIHPVAHPLVMYKFFGSVNEVDSHNKSRHSYLALEKLWVTQCGCLRLCTIVAM